jgi:hypothetical protein
MRNSLSGFERMPPQLPCGKVSEIPACCSTAAIFSLANPEANLDAPPDLGGGN